MNRETIVAVGRNVQGDIINFKTSSGRIISYRKALSETDQGIIGGVVITEDERLAFATDTTFQFLPSLD